MLCRKVVVLCLSFHSQYGRALSLKKPDFSVEGISPQDVKSKMMANVPPTIALFQRQNRCR
jgi:hypothetical protein